MRTKAASALISALLVICFCQLSWCDTSEQSSNDLTSVLNTLFSGEADFPPPFKNNPPDVIENPDITLFISRKHVNDVLEAYLKTPIPLDQEEGHSKNNIRADKLVVKPEATRNVLLVFVKGGVLHLEGSYAGVGGDLRLKHAEFELAPVCKSGPNGQVVLETRVRCVALDIEGTSPVIDIGIANLLQNLYLDKHPIQTVNLSDLVPSLKETKGNGTLDIQLVKAAILMQTKGIEIRTSWKIR